MAEAMTVMKPGGSFKSFAVLLANTTISESGSDINHHTTKPTINFCKPGKSQNLKNKIKKNEENPTSTRWVPSESVFELLSIDIEIQANRY